MYSDHMIKIVTHSGSFHADDVFAVAAFQLLLGKENVEIVRTRDDEIIATGDYVVDVGSTYNHKTKRYDHHQSGAPVRENGIPYAGFGLMWRHYGEEICGNKEIADKIEEKLCWPIDLCDNAISVWENGKYDIRPFEWDGVLKAWSAESEYGEDMDEQFLVVVDFAREYLNRIIKRQRVKVGQSQRAEALYESSSNKAILVSEEYLPRSLFVQYAEAQVLIFPRQDKGDWATVAISAGETGFETRVSFPQEWAGLRDGELATVSGINDAKFCHKNSYLFIAGSKEGAIEAAKLAR